MAHISYYSLYNLETTEKIIGTASELAELLGVNTAFINKMSKLGCAIDGYYCTKIMKDEYDRQIIGGGTYYNTNLDNIEMEARKHGMSYGVYVGLTEGKWKHDWVNKKAEG